MFTCQKIKEEEYQSCKFELDIVFLLPVILNKNVS